MIRSLVVVFIYLIVIAVLVGLVHHVVDVFQPGTPLARLIKIAATVIGVLAACLVLLDFAGVADVDLLAPRARV